MTSEPQPGDHDAAAQTYAVDPAELVFVFAVSQLSHHLLQHLSWRGAGETLVLLVAVFGAWYYTSWQATLLGVERPQALIPLMTVIFVGLFMNAAVPRAFQGSGWDFVAPYLLIQLGGGAWTLVYAPGSLWKGHYRRTLVWLVATAPLWAIGAATDPKQRLAWWAAAAVVDLAGTWLAHPLPGVRLHSENTGHLEAVHMLERSRLFLIVALGETILTTGSAIALVPLTPVAVASGTAALISTVALWFLLFRGAGRLVAEHVESGTIDPTRSTRLAGNVLTVMVAELIALAVGNEIAIAHPHGPVPESLALLVFGGPAGVLLAHAWFLWAAPHTSNLQRLLGVVALAVFGGVSAALAPPYLTLMLAGAALAGLVVVAEVADRRRESSRPAA